ncbi:hypothetical protein [Comamonas sp. F1-6]|uniref:hypothetical protein n=1 Tax=Comamonas sp. F1-6 TaxID=673550 RepID=UPI0031D7769E
MPVESQTPFNEYTGNGVTTVFAYQFQILIATDLAVFVDGVLKANGADYTISGVGSLQGGQVTFAVAPASGADVLLFRQMVLARDTDYQTNGDLKEAVLDRDFDRIWLVLQSVSSRLGTALRFPFPEQSRELPPALNRANKMLSFDSMGQPITALPTSDSSQQLRLDLFSEHGGEIVNFRQAPDAVVRSVTEVLSNGVISPFIYGGNWDGVGDDTEAIRKAHALANLKRVPVSYAGISKFCIQANARIPVYTSVDFFSARMVILGGVEASPSFDSFNTIFIFSDPDCPLVTVTGPVLASNLVRGAIFPTRGLFDGHGYAKLECGLQVPDRAKTGTQNYTQAFKVNRASKVSHPLSSNCSAFASAITVSYRKTSKTPLTISNVGLVEGAWNNQRVFQIERCNTHIKNFDLLFDGDGAQYNNVSEIVCLLDVSDVTIDGYMTTGRPVTTSTGSYCLAIYGGADIYVDNMEALTGWGAIGSNNVNGLYFEDCILNRVDAHSSGHNIFVEECALHDIGVKIGWGGGVVKVTNTTLYGCPAISTRDDYGGHFDGAWIVDGFEISMGNSFGTFPVIDCATSPIGASTAIQPPDSIVSNLQRVAGSTAAGGEITPVAIKIRQNGDQVRAPNLVSVSNIESSEGWRFSLKLDWMNFITNARGEMRVNINDVDASMRANTSSGVQGYPAFASTPASRAFLSINCSAVRNLALRCLRPDITSIDLLDCALNEATVPNPSRLKILGGQLIAPTEGVSTVVIGALRGSATREYTFLQGVTVSPYAEWDLSKVAALSGVLVERGTLTATLPSGVTPAMAFTGWNDGVIFP